MRCILTPKEAWRIVRKQLAGLGEEIDKIEKEERERVKEIRKMKGLPIEKEREKAIMITKETEKLLDKLEEENERHI